MASCADYKCIKCLFDKYSAVEKINIDDNERTNYLKELMKIVADAPYDMSAPEIVERITPIGKKYGIDVFDYSEEKKMFNNLILSFEDKITNKIRNSKTPLKLAMNYSFIGNYIDFGAVKDVSPEKIEQMMEDAEKISLDETETENFFAELQKCKNLVFLTDNCGEIVFDKIFIKFIKEIYKDININVIVRGRNVLNDATTEDAEMVGLNKVVRVIHNGTGIAGTVLSRINGESKKLIDSADLIISKGMGNFETLSGCKKNIYYMFMCKCLKFCEKFEVEQYTYMLQNELRMKL